MKVLLINGSPHKNGTTAVALGAVAKTLESEGIGTETVTIGGEAVRGCVGCRKCAELGKCVFGDDLLNETAAKMREADGIVIGSPVYYAGINGTLKSFLDRAFYSSPGRFRFKPAACFVALRRGGGTAALQTINQYFEIAEMLITPSVYWNAIHGLNAEDGVKDEEAVQMAEVTGRNMAYLLKLKAASDLPLPKKPDKIMTNFIR